MTNTNYLSRVKKGLRMLGTNGVAPTLHEAVYSFYSRRSEAIVRRDPERSTDGGPPTVSIGEFELGLHPSMVGISEQLSRFGSHEPMSAATYLGLLRSGDHILDVGANIGYYLLLAWQRMNKSGRVLAFEPVPNVFEVLSRNVSKNILDARDTVTLTRCAIGDKTGTATFYESEIPNWGSLIRTEQLEPKRELQVPIKTLDDVVRAQSGFHPTVLRMDVEGGELRVLAGARGVLERYRPLLFIEFHTFILGWDAVREELLQLKRLGYKKGTLIDRVWDQAWIGRWIRDRHCWRGSLDYLLSKAQGETEPLSVFTLVLEQPSGTGRVGNQDREFTDQQ